MDMTIQEMINRKQELGYSNEQISALSGVPLGTVIKIFCGVTKNPRSTTIRALEKVLAPSRPSFSYEYPDDRLEYDASSNSILKESVRYEAAALRNDHKYTIDDYYALPDDQRAELIDGIFYDMSSPRVIHQLIIGELYLQLKQCEKKHKGACRVLLSPCDVQLDCDQYTMLQPDLLVICDKNKIKERVCYGAPDLAIEVLSPSSRSRDCVLKLNKYMNAGVQEYWIVDPEYLKIIVYRLDEEKQFRVYSFHDTVPVGISDGSCSIDFQDVFDEIQDLL